MPSIYETSPTGRNFCYPSNANASIPAPILSYGYSSGAKLNGITGNWTPFTVSQEGKLLVDIGLPSINVSGNLSLGASVSISGGYIGITGYTALEESLARIETSLRVISGGNNGRYDVTMLEVTNGQVSIPTGVYSWSVAVQSGNGSFKGVTIPAGFSTNGGGYGNGWTLKNAINVGITGGKMIITYEN
jgi:hypothetical protein